MSLEKKFRLLIERGNPLWTVTKITDQTNDLKERSMCWIMLIVFRQTFNFRIKKLCLCLRTTKLWLRWLSNEGASQWDTFPGPTELRLIGYSIGSIWTQQSKSSTSTPKTKSQTYWPREISHVMNGILFCVYLTLAISVLQIVLKWCILRCPRMLILFALLLVGCEEWFCSLVGSLPGARRAIVWVVAEVRLRLAWESNASNFDFFQILWRRRCASPRRFCRTCCWTRDAERCAPPPRGRVSVTLLHHQSQ